LFPDWSEEAFTFDRDDHPEYISNLGHYPLASTSSLAMLDSLKSRWTEAVASTSCTPRLSTSWGSIGLGCELTQRYSTVSCQDIMPPLSVRSICPSALGLLPTSRGKPSPSRLLGSEGPTTPF
jgi:hypothetical protein